MAQPNARPLGGQRTRISGRTAVSTKEPCLVAESIRRAHGDAGSVSNSGILVQRDLARRYSFDKKRRGMPDTLLWETVVHFATIPRLVNNYVSPLGEKMTELRQRLEFGEFARFRLARRISERLREAFGRTAIRERSETRERVAAALLARGVTPPKAAKVHVHRCSSNKRILATGQAPRATLRQCAV